MKEKPSDSEDCDRDGRSPRHRRRSGYQAGLRRHGRSGPRPQRSLTHPSATARSDEGETQ